MRILRIVARAVVVSGLAIVASTQIATVAKAYSDCLQTDYYGDFPSGIWWCSCDAPTDCTSPLLGNGCFNPCDPGDDYGDDCNVGDVCDPLLDG